MFIPKRRKWGSGSSTVSGGGNSATKFTIQLTAGYEPVSGGTTQTTVRFPVLRKPADAVRPQFGIPKRKNWRQDNWSNGWGQFRFDDKAAFWYGSAHTFRDNEISAGALLTNPTTNIAAAGVSGFCEYGSTRALYSWSDTVLSSYSGYGTTEAWAEVNTTRTGANKTAIVDVREEGGVMYLTQTGQNYFTLTDTTWADGGSVKSHFAYHDGTIYAANANTVYYGAAWAYDVTVGGTEDNINAMISFGSDLIVLKSDGIYAIGSKPQDATIVAWEPKVMPIQTFLTERHTDTGKHWAVWGGRLWFNAGTSLAYYDGLDVVMVEYPWGVSPTALSTIYSITAMDDTLLVGYAGYVLSYTDKGAGTAGKWHSAAYLGSTTRKPNGLWFSRIPTTSRLWFGLDDIADDANNSKFAVMQNGLFMPSTFAASSTFYSSWFDDGDQTINKWLMEAYVEVDNCDANNTVTLAYAKDGDSATFTNIGTAITADGITKLPTTGFVDNGSLVAYRSLQLRATIVSAGTVTPIIKALEVTFQPRTPDRRQWDLTLLCTEDWEVGAYNSTYTSKQYRDFLWGASQLSVPMVLVDEYGDSYTVSMVLVETVPYTEEGEVKGMEIRVHLEEA